MSEYKLALFTLLEFAASVASAVAGFTCALPRQTATAGRRVYQQVQIDERNKRGLFKPSHDITNDRGGYFMPVTSSMLYLRGAKTAWYLAEL